MQCKEATSLIIPFIERELPEDKLKIFLEHIRNCKECRDWFSTYNFKGEFEKELKEANAYVRWTNIMSFFKDLITAFAIIGILIILTLQLQLWGLIG